MNGMVGAMGLGIVLSFRDAASGAMGQAQAHIADLGEEADKARKRFETLKTAAAWGAGMLTAGTAIVGTMGYLANASGKFEYALTAVGATAETTSEELAQLKSKALQLGLETEWDPVQVTQGFNALASAGYDTTKMLATIKPVLDMATGSMGQLNLEQSAALMSGTMNAYGIDVSEAGMVTDKLLKSTLVTNLSMSDLGTYMGEAASSVAAYGGSLDDTLIALGMMRNAGIGASSATTGLKNALAKLKDSGVQKGLSEQFGVDVLDSATGNFRNFMDVIADVAAAGKEKIDQGLMGAGDFSTAMNKMFGLEASTFINTAMNMGVPVMRDGKKVILDMAEATAYYREQMDNSAGTAEAFAEKLKRTWEGIKTMISGTISTFGMAIGDTVLPMFKGLASAANEVLAGMLSWAMANPGILKAATVTGVFIGSVLLLAGAFNLAATSGAGLMVVLAPLWPYILGISAAMGLLTLVGLKYQKQVENAGTIFRAVFGLLSQGSIDEGLFKQLKDNGLTKVVAKIIMYFEQFKPLVDGVKEGFADFYPIIEEIWNLIIDGLGVIGVRLGGGMAGMSGLGKALFWIGRATMWVVGIFVAGFAGIGALIVGIVDIIALLGDGIGSAASDMVDDWIWVEKMFWKMWRSITGAIKSVGKFFGISFSDTAAESASANITTTPSSATGLLSPSLTNMTNAAQGTPLPSQALLEPSIRGSMAAQSPLAGSLAYGSPNVNVSQNIRPEFHIGVSIGDEPIRDMIVKEKKAERSRNYEGGISTWRGVPSFTH